MAKFQISDLIGSVDHQQVINDYMKWQDDVFDLILQQNPHLTSSIRNSGQIPLHLLSYPDRVAQMGRYRSITRMNQVFNALGARDSGVAPTPDLIKSLGANRAKEVTNIMHGLKSIRGFDTEAPFAKAPVSFVPGGNPLDALYARMNINFDLSPKDVRAGIPNSSSAALAHHHFGPGVYNMPATAPSFFTTSNTMKPGSKFMTFDIETAGLMRNQIREVAFRTGVADSAGMLSGNGASNQLMFEASQMSRGSVGFSDGIGGGVKSHTLDEFVGLKFGIASDQIHPANEFGSRMTGFLESMRDSDYLIGHNIGSFDIPQLHSQLTSSALYTGGDEGFRQLVDAAFSGVQDKVIDTLTLAQRAPNLAELGVAKELADLKSGKVYSIENLLLETDLAEKIGIDKLKTLIKDNGGLHVGAVDDEVTRFLFQHVNDIQMKTLTDKDLRSAIIRSSALTPITDLDMSNITPRVKRILRSSEGTLFSGVNPIEHQILETRNLRLGITNQNIVDPASMIFRTNMFNNMAYKGISGRRNPANMILGQRSDISAREFRDFQKSMARKNMPFAGLSLEERRFGTSLARMTSGLAPGSAAQTIAPLASDLMVSHFKTFEGGSVDYLPRSLRPSMPVGFLKDSGLLEQGTLLKMSVVERTAQRAEESVNLVFNFKNQNQVESFANRLSTLADDPNSLSIASILGYSDTVDQTDAAMLNDVSRFREAVRAGLPDQIRSTGLKTGISVGQLGVEESRGVIAGLKQFHGMDALRDTSMLDIGLPFADDIMTDDLNAGRGVIRTAGAVLDRGLTDVDRVSFGVSVGKTQYAYESMRQLATMPENASALRAAQVASNMGPEGARAVLGAYETAQVIRPHVPKILGFAALGTIGMHFWNKRKENQPYNELFEASQTTDTRYSVADLLQMKKDEGINLSHQRYDPLSTAYVTENLHNAKIGHTNMSWDRNSSLYGGVL